MLRQRVLDSDLKGALEEAMRDEYREVDEIVPGDDGYRVVGQVIHMKKNENFSKKVFVTVKFGNRTASNQATYYRLTFIRSRSGKKLFVLMSSSIEEAKIHFILCQRALLRERATGVGIGSWVVLVEPKVVGEFKGATLLRLNDCVLPFRPEPVPVPCKLMLESDVERMTFFCVEVTRQQFSGWRFVENTCIGEVCDSQYRLSCPCVVVQPSGGITDTLGGTVHVAEGLHVDFVSNRFRKFLFPDDAQWTELSRSSVFPLRTALREKLSGFGSFLVEGWIKFPPPAQGNELVRVPKAHVFRIHGVRGDVGQCSSNQSGGTGSAS